jgi:hypothetical protein
VTDAPIDLVIGLLASVLTAGTFLFVLLNVGARSMSRYWPIESVSD